MNKVTNTLFSILSNTVTRMVALLSSFFLRELRVLRGANYKNSRTETQHFSTRKETVFSTRLETPVNPYFPVFTAFFSRLSHGWKLVLMPALATSLMLAPQPAQAQDETNSVVNVWTDTVSPAIESTNITWGIDIRNNSNILPEGGPWYESITHARLFDLYSSSPPTSGSLPVLWNFANATTNDGDTYTINLSCSLPRFQLGSGQKEKFGFRTYIPSTNHVLVIGTQRGQGRFPSASWQPRDDPLYPEGGDPFHGPAGAIQVLSQGEGVFSPATNRFYLGSNAVFNAQANPNYRLEKIIYNGNEILFDPNVTSTNYSIPDIGKTGTVIGVFGPALWRVGFEPADIGNPRYTIVTNIPHGTILTQEVDVVHQVSEGERRVFRGFRVE